MLLYDMYVMCYVMSIMIWTGRSLMYGPEGQDDTDRKVREVGPEGLLELRDRSPLRHIDRKVLQSYSLEWRMCYMWYFGELAKHLCLSFV